MVPRRLLKPSDMDNVLSPRAIAAALTELWSPRVIAEIDEH